MEISSIKIQKKDKNNTNIKKINKLKQIQQNGPDSITIISTNHLLKFYSKKANKLSKGKKQ
jgi:hypothetical protein